MKKILSILVFVLLGIGTMYGQSAGTSTIHAYAIYDPDCDSIYEQGGGTVQAKAIQQAESKVSDYNTFGDVGVYSTAIGKGYYKRGGWFQEDKKYEYYIAADAISAADGYYFYRWSESDTFVADAKASASATTSTKIAYDKSSTKTVYAFFEPIQVLGSAVKQHAYTYDVGGASDGEGGTEGLVYFTVSKQSKGMSDFDDCYLEAYSDSYDPTGFEIVGEPYHRDGTNRDTVYVRIKYTNQNKAATARVNVVLKAKGPSSKQVNKRMIYGYSDLIPVFTTNPVDTVDFTPVTPFATGESKTITIQTIYDKIATQNATWKVTLLDPETKKAKDANAKGFKLLTAAAVNKPQVSFTALEGINQADLTAWLVIQATYKDAANASKTHRDTLILTGDAGKVITLNGAQATTRPISIEHSATETWQEESVEFLTTLTDIDVTTTDFPTGADENKIQYVWTEGDTKVKVRLSSTMSPGLHTPTVNFSSSGVEADLNIEALVYLAQPQLTATTDKLGNAVRLQWAKVLGATHYVVYGNEVVDEEVVRTSLDTIVVEDPAQTTYTYDATSNGKDILAIGKIYEFSVEAVFMPSQVANRMSEVIAATPALFETITSDEVSKLTLYTGTDLYKEGHSTYGKVPYTEKYVIDLAPTFSAVGKPLFDRLYVFGMTTSPTPAVFEGKTGYTIKVPNSADGSDAITPCYIYEPNGNAYTLVRAITNMNMPEKDTYFSVTANSQKYYLTGYCPYATTGWGQGTDETQPRGGVWLVSGAANAKIDLYLHNLQVSARNYTENGRAASSISTAGTSLITYDFAVQFGTQEKFINVSASVLAFYTNNTNNTATFKPTVHLLGKNILKGSGGFIQAGAVGDYIPGGIHSSGIHILATKTNQCTELSIDDEWLISQPNATIRTNGILDVRPTGTGRPSIDLGNDKSTVNFNGGQIFLKNSIPTSTKYKCTFAVGYRYHEEDYLIAKARLYGMGSDLSGGSVNFNDGTINCDTLTDKNLTDYAGCYFNKYTMKCPLNTKINGGSHNCDIMACSGPTASGGSPKNKWGETLVSTRVAITNIPTEPYYLAEIDFANDPGLLKCIKADDPYYNMTLNDYYAQKNDSYLHESMKAEEGFVTLMVPVQFTDKEAVVETTTRPWALCIPAVTASSGLGIDLSLGGEETVISDEKNKTNYLLYSEIDAWLQSAAETYTIPEGLTGAGASISIDSKLFENITNENSYRIEKAQYILKSVRGDEWMLFCPPFDVTNVYVLEAYPETDLVNIAKTSTYDAQLLQAQANMDFFYYVCYYADNKDGGTNKDLWALYNLWYNDGWIKGAGKIQLNHFTGRNYDAHYYLQRSSGTWEWDAENNKFKTDWAYLPADTAANADEYYKVMHGETEYNVVMKKGEIYSLKFPYMYYGYRENEDKWDYWTGKYIIFEGLGPQEIAGKSHHTVITADKDASAAAVIRGNSTFAKMTVTKDKAYYCDFTMGEQKFTGPYNRSEVVSPLSGFVLAEGNTRNMPNRKIAIDMMTGDVTYEPSDGSENTVTGTPTIAGEREMLVYTVTGGLGVVPVVPQHVSIYNAAGQLVVSQYLTDDTRFTLPTGIYLVRGEKDQAKAMVK